MMFMRWLKQKKVRDNLNALHGQSTLRLIATVLIGMVADIAALIAIALSLDKEYNEIWPDSVEIQFAIYFFITLFTWVLLPFALRHVPREYDPYTNYPGTFKTFVACIIVLASVGLHPLRPSVIAVLISFCSRRSMRWVLVGIATFTVSLGLRVWDPEWLVKPYAASFVVVLAWMFFVFPAVAIGLARGQRREKQNKLLAQAALASSRAESLEARARQEERDRIARDMHDTLSHRLSLISVYAGGLKFNEKLSLEEIRNSAATIQSEAQLAVDDLRSVLHALRFDDRVDPRASLQELTDQARASGTKISLRYESVAAKEALNGLQTMASHTLNSAIQEGLTNARKHAPGKKILIEVTESPNGVRVTMTNSKPNTDNDASGGYGLIGLRERAQLSGGSFELTDTDHSFSWALTLPTKREEKASQ